MTAKLKEAAFWMMAILFTMTIVAMFWGGIAIVVLGMIRWLGGE